MILQEDVAFEFGAEPLDSPELAGSHGLEDLRRAQFVFECLEPVQPVLDIRALHHNAGVIELAGRTRFLPGGGRQHVIESRRLLFVARSGKAVGLVVNDLVFVADGTGALLGDEILHSAVGPGTQPPLERELEVVERPVGDNIAAATAALMFQTSVFDTPALVGERRFLEPPPTARARAVEQEAPAGLALGGRQLVGRRFGCGSGERLRLEGDRKNEEIHNPTGEAITHSTACLPCARMQVKRCAFPPLPERRGAPNAIGLNNGADSMRLLEGKTGIVFGVANRRSIAWAIAQAWAQAGATLAFTYQGERLKENVEELAATFGADTLILPCDVRQDDEIASVFAALESKFGTLHLLLHSVAFAPRDALEGAFIDTSREAFRIAHDVSAYSLVALARAAAPLMTEGGSILGLSYYGARKVVPHYNVMGVAKAALEASTRYLAYDLGPKRIRVNCISAGPVNTLAARGIAGFQDMLRHYELKAPLKRNVTADELGATGTFLASDGAAAITGQILYVDCGYEIMGM